MPHDTRHDVVIAGAGPAGAAAACVLARAGARVLVLERAVFPRDKLCAGLLTWKTMDVLERLFETSPEKLASLGVVGHRADRYRIRHRGVALARDDLFYPFHFARRRFFDDWVLRQAVAAGAHVRFGETVRAVDIATGRVTTESGADYAARHVIGADGAASAVRRAFPVDQAAWRARLGMGMECFIDRRDSALAAPAHPDLADDFPTVYAGFIRTGYGWVFPHGDRVAVGLGGLASGDARHMRECFGAFLDFLGLSRDWLSRTKAHLLPYGNFLASPVHDRALLAGDAAGLVENLFGEGIYYALRSGELAGQAVAAALAGGDARAAYLDGLSRDVYPELAGSLRLRELIFSWARFGPTPLWCFLRLGGKRLVEMAHGVRSFRWLRRRAAGPAGRDRE